MGEIVQGLFSTNLYKPKQGRVARQVTAAALAITALIGLWQLSNYLIASGAAMQYGLPGGLLVVSLWIIFRIVNLPTFTEFLIAVEAEMKKVSWPSRGEMVRATIVVLVTIFALAAILTIYDAIWKVLFTWLGVL